MKELKKNIIILLALAGISGVSLWAWCNATYRNDIINCALFIATALTALVGYVQLNAVKEQMNADFLLKFNSEFFGNKIIQEIIVLIEENENLLKANGGPISDYELDNYLGYFELISWYEKKGMMDFELIDETFGHYISLAWKNSEINGYIKETRTGNNDPRYYLPFEKIAERIILGENQIRNSENYSEK